MNENREKQDAFIRTREVMCCCPNAPFWNDLAPAMKQKYFMPYWSEARLRRHLEMIKAFGFNSIQVTACGQVALNSGVRQEIWQEKLILTCRMARELGLGVSQFVWGSYFYDIDRNVSVGDLDWHNPADRKRMEEFFRAEAFLAPWLDRVVTHWVDPGGAKVGCPQCSIDTAVEIHNSMLAIFRAQNPRIRGAFSNWMLNWMSEEWPASEEGWQPGRWRGYTGVPVLTGNPGLDRNSDIGIGRTNYTWGDGMAERHAVSRIKVPDLQTIAAAGRSAGVWSWYTTDVEILPALHVRTAILQDYFNRMPDEVQRGLSWLSVEDNCHGLNMQNLFIAGRLMQDRRQDANVLLDEFAVILVGKTQAAPVAQALRAIEQVRSSDTPYLVWAGGATLPSPGATDPKRLSLEWIQINRANIEGAIRVLAPVSVAPSFTPALPLTLSPAEYLEELRAHLEAIRQYLTFLGETVKVAQLASQKASPEKIRAAIQALPPVVNDPAHTAGLEAWLYQQKLAALRKEN